MRRTLQRVAKLALKSLLTFFSISGVLGGEVTVTVLESTSGDG